MFYQSFNSTPFIYKKKIIENCLLTAITYCSFFNKHRFPGSVLEYSCSVSSIINDTELIITVWFLQEVAQVSLKIFKKSSVIEPPGLY